jgi:hypothetical protein
MSSPGARGLGRGAQGAQVNPLNPYLFLYDSALTSPAATRPGGSIIAL